VSEIVRKSFLVIGGAKHIGAKVVTMLVEQGHHVTFTYASSEQAAKALEASLEEQYPDPVVVSHWLDLTDPNCNTTFARMLRGYSYDGLSLNAAGGIMQPELAAAVNHIGQVDLLERLGPVLKQDATVVWSTSNWANRYLDYTDDQLGAYAGVASTKYAGEQALREHSQGRYLFRTVASSVVEGTAAPTLLKRKDRAMYAAFIEDSPPITMEVFARGVVDALLGNRTESLIQL
jgi:NAD(P)-dependent dehydrogenase (short-subunit alcohol dehydrogenase family)